MSPIYGLEPIPKAFNPPFIQPDIPLFSGVSVVATPVGGIPGVSVVVTPVGGIPGVSVVVTPVGGIPGVSVVATPVGGIPGVSVVATPVEGIPGVPLALVVPIFIPSCADTDVTRYKTENKENMINADDKRVIIFINPPNF
jgi:hypothetical protein